MPYSNLGHTEDKLKVQCNWGCMCTHRTRLNSHIVRSRKVNIWQCSLKQFTSGHAKGALVDSVTAVEDVVVVTVVADVGVDVVVHPTVEPMGQSHSDEPAIATQCYAMHS